MSGFMFFFASLKLVPTFLIFSDFIMELVFINLNSKYNKKNSHDFLWIHFLFTIIIIMIIT